MDAGSRRTDWRPAMEPPTAGLPDEAPPGRSVAAGAAPDEPAGQVNGAWVPALVTEAAPDASAWVPVAESAGDTTPVRAEPDTTAGPAPAPTGAGAAPATEIYAAVEPDSAFEPDAAVHLDAAAEIGDA